MDITICQNCGASHEGVRAICANCGGTHLEHLAELQAGEAVYACGYCRHPRRLGPAENPAVTRKEFGRIQKGEALQIPLTVWNTIFKCEECHYWNWVVLDDRVTGFELACPDCGKLSVIGTLGRHLEFSKRFLGPVVSGDLRQQHRPVDLSCGHHLYLPVLVLESKSTVHSDEPPEATPPAAASDPAPESGSGKKKTQPLPIVPPPK